MNTRSDGAAWSTRARAVAGALALAAVVAGSAGFALGLRLDLGPVSLVGNALFVLLGVVLAYAAVTEATWPTPELESTPYGTESVGEVGFAFDFEDETV